MDRRALMLAAACTLTLIAGCRNVNPEEAMAKAVAFHAAHDYQSARVELMNALQADPKNVKARLLAAEVMIELGDGVAAEREITLAREGGAGEAETRALLARAYLQQMLPDKALDLLGEEADDSDSAEIYRLRGEAFGALDKDAQSAQQFEHGLAAFPQDPLLLVTMARLRHSERALDEAATLAAKAATIAPALLDVQMMNADVALAKGDLTNAQIWFDKAIAAYPLDLPAKLGKATVLWERNDRKGALAIAAEVLKKDPKSPVAIMMKATDLADAGKEEEALALMRTTIPFFENDPTSLRIKGDLEFRKGFYATAARHYRQAVNQRPDAPELRYKLASALVKDGDTDGARTVLAPVAARDDIPEVLQPLL